MLCADPLAPSVFIQRTTHAKKNSRRVQPSGKRLVHRSLDIGGRSSRSDSTAWFAHAKQEFAVVMRIGGRQNRESGERTRFRYIRRVKERRS